jgi:hypothetical protein
MLSKVNNRNLGIGFLSFSLISLSVAVFVLIVWVIVNWGNSYNQLRRLDSGSIQLKNGQTLQIEYPAFIFANDQPSEIQFILRGKASAPVTQPVMLSISVPSSLTTINPESQKYSETIILEFWPDRNGHPVAKAIGFANAKNLEGCFSKSQEIQIFSPDLEEDIKINPIVEALKPASLRNFLDISINKNSPAILAATGLLSAGSFLLAQQFRKLQEREIELENRRYQEFQDEDEEFKNLLETDTVYAAAWLIKRWQQLDREAFEDIEKAASFSGEENSIELQRQKAEQRALHKLTLEQEHLSKLQTLMLLSSWQAPFGLAIINALQQERTFQARKIVNNMRVLDALARNLKLDEESRSGLFVDLCSIYEKRSPKENKEISLKLGDEEVNRVQEIYTVLGEPVSPLIIQMVEELVTTPEGVIMVNKIFNTNEIGKNLLFKSNIIRALDKQQDNKENQEAATSASAIKATLLTERITWQPIWPTTRPYTPGNLLYWLGRQDPSGDFERNPFGPEFGELDNGLMGKKFFLHPVYRRLKTSEPMVVFGERGSGKTTLAMRLTNDYQAAADYSRESVFPIYHALQAQQISLDWMIAVISRALADFVANNPRNYLYAEDEARRAMGRLITKYYGSIDEIKAKMQHSRNYSSDLNKRVVDEIETLTTGSNVDSRPEENLDLLYKARPVGFQRIDFVIDMQATDEIKIQTEQLNELVKHSLPLARRNIILKVFTPKMIEPHLRMPPPVLVIDLDWSEADLQGLLDARTDKKFSLLCKVSEIAENPAGLIVKSAQGSPRGLIKMGNLLMQYAETNLKEGQKLDKEAFRFAGILA